MTLEEKINCACKVEEELVELIKTLSKQEQEDLIKFIKEKQDE